MNYEASGWVVHQVSDIWAKTSPDRGQAVWALWPMGGAWLCTHLWEHYTFTMDKVKIFSLSLPFLICFQLQDCCFHLFSHFYFATVCKCSISSSSCSFPHSLIGQLEIKLFIRIVNALYWFWSMHYFEFGDLQSP